MDTKGLLGISPKGWKTLLSWTLSGTAGCVIFSVIFNYFAFRDLETVAVARALATATILPILLAGPLFFYLILKLRELARVNHQLNELATKDFGTGLLNRRALIMRAFGHGNRWQIQRPGPSSSEHPASSRRRRRCSGP